MNDPAGLVHHDGNYHLFYQRDPHDVFVADVRWGHAVSADLLHWEDRQEAIAADPVLGVPFTGSAVVDDSGLLCAPGVACLVAVHTHAFGDDGQQKQSVSFSSDDGLTFASYTGNPVIGPISEADFRDPNVRWDAGRGRWRMTVGARDRVLFYASPDLVTWTLTGSFTPTGAPSGVFECPDLLELPGADGVARWVLKVDVNPGLLQAGPSVYWVGSFDGSTFTPDTPGEGLRVDGPDFYAAQSFSDTAGADTVWLGWTSAWSYASATPTVGWRGGQSLPRSVEVRDTPDGPRLAQTPVGLDVAGATCSLVDEAELTLDGATPLRDDVGEAYVLRATLLPDDAAVVGFDVHAADGERTRLGYDRTKGVLFLDRTQSGDVDFAPGFAGRTEVHVELPPNGLDVVVIVDRNTVEVFAAEGLAVITASVYPKVAVHGLVAFAEGGVGRARGLRVRSLVRTVRSGE